jgi:hypothetical protein
VKIRKGVIKLVKMKGIHRVRIGVKLSWKLITREILVSKTGSKAANIGLKALGAIYFIVIGKFSSY